MQQMLNKWFFARLQKTSKISGFVESYSAIQMGCWKVLIVVTTEAGYECHRRCIQYVSTASI